MMKKTIVAVAIVGSALTASAGTAFASHDHFVAREDRDGDTHCRYIAEGQTSKEHQPSEETDPGGGKFHTNVHQGQPGTDEHGTTFDKRGSAAEAECDYVEDKDSKSQRP